MKWTMNRTIMMLVVLGVILAVAAMYRMREGLESHTNAMIFGSGLHALAGAAPKEVVNRFSKADDILDGKLFEGSSGGLDCNNGRPDLNPYRAPMSDGEETTCEACCRDDWDCDACNDTWCGMEQSKELVRDLPEIRDRRITGAMRVPNTIA